MWYKKLVNFYVFILSILTVNLLSDRLTTFIFGFRFMTHSTKATIIGMCILVFVLYPAYHYLNNWSETVAKRIFKIGKHAGGKFIGVTLAFFFSLFILFLLYMQLWFGTERVFEWMKLSLENLLQVIGK